MNIATPKKTILLQNKKAEFHYEIIKTYEASMALLGHEVKSLREKKAHFAASFITITDKRLYVHGFDISPYNHLSHTIKIDTLRTRELFIHKNERTYLEGKIKEKGYALIPTAVYSKGNLIKMTVALAKGKKLYEKKEAIKKRDLDRELAKTLKNY